MSTTRSSFVARVNWLDEAIHIAHCLHLLLCQRRWWWATLLIQGVRLLEGVWIPAEICLPVQTLPNILVHQKYCSHLFRSGDILVWSVPLPELTIDMSIKIWSNTWLVPPRAPLRLPLLCSFQDAALLTSEVANGWKKRNWLSYLPVAVSCSAPHPNGTCAYWARRT